LLKKIAISSLNSFFRSSSLKRSRRDLKLDIRSEFCLTNKKGLRKLKRIIEGIRNALETFKE
jgi:hypothetical protein